MNTCIECKHFKGGQDAEPYNPHGLPLPKSQEPLCMSPQAVTREPIYGKALCREERASNKGCGKGGKFWEPRNKG